jgi:hypothetical protein
MPAKKEFSDEEIKVLYKVAKALEKGDPIAARRKGFTLEKIIYAKLKEMEPSGSYKTEGEQIDGSFFWMGQTFLLEAKWHKDALPVSEIYNFKGKLDGKFHTSSGIFISMSGFSEDAPNALRFGKELNVLLFDVKDMDAIIEDDVPFKDVLKFKLRAAGDTGDPYVSYDIKSKVAKIKDSEPVISKGALGRFVKKEMVTEKPTFLVFCEGRSDILICREIFARLPFAERVAFKFVELGGSRNLLSSVTISNLLSGYRNEYLSGVLIIMDEDAKEIVAQSRELITKLTSNSANAMNVLLMTMDSDRVFAELHRGGKRYANKIRKITRFVDANSWTLEDQEITEAERAVTNIMSDAEWDFKAKEVILRDAYESRLVYRMKTIDQLRSKLDEIADGAAISVANWDREYLNERDALDFSDIVEDVLREYGREIKRMGWSL